MSSIQILAAVGNGVFVLAMAAVGIRLLRLWRRSRQLPELAVGGGFLLVTGGFPVMAAGGIGSASSGSLALGVVGLGLAGIGLGAGALNLFTWKVFRPQQGWAAALAWGTFAAAGVICAGAVRAIAAAPAASDPIAAGVGWWTALRLLFEVWYVWTGVESLGEYARARRRLALGLSDPVVVNRFLLWGTMGAFLAVDGVAAMALERRGASPLHDPVSAFLLAANGLVAGTLMLLTFMPPRRYLEILRRRPAQGA